jgi:hypothetical protein
MEEGHAVDTQSAGNPDGGLGQLQCSDSKLSVAEPMLRADSSSVLRSDVVSTGDVGGPGAERSEAPPASGLPCLNSNNSDNASASPWNLLTGAHRKVAFCLKGEIMALVEQFGIERLGFLTLTFADHVTAIKEASRRFNNLNRRVLKGRYKRIVAVPERQKSGRLQFSLPRCLGCGYPNGIGL